MHVYDTAVDHPLVNNTAWLPSRPAEAVAPDIWLSRSNSYPYLVASPDGDVVINTGVSHQGPRHRQRFEEAVGRPLDVRAIVITQSHLDHGGGWSAFNNPDTETIVSAAYERVLAEKARLTPYFNRRPTAGMYVRRPEPGEPLTSPAPDARLPTPTVRVEEPHRFSVGGRTFEVRRAAGGESLDGLLVWLPDQATVFCGNLMGALYGALPHLSTIRGDRPRSAQSFIACVEEMLALQPELLCTGHDQPIHGRQRIQDEVGHVVEATRHLYNVTLDGMAAGCSLEQLMAQVRLPDHLRTAKGRGPVSWYVRAVWEEFTGWYRAESVTDLYGSRPNDIWPELVEMSGGPVALLFRAASKLDAGEPVAALHFIDIVLAVNAGDGDALSLKARVLETLMEQDANEHYDLSRFLEMEIRRARATETRP